MSLPRRLRRHLSYANVIASLALFAALGGSAYAASQINGNNIVKHSIGANKLKNETITSKQVKKNSLNSSVIDLSTLATVPSAQTAVTANSATTANTATSAGSANSAGSAEHANSADSATNANHAATAGDAETLAGKTAADLTDACPAATELFGGMCWDTQPRPLKGWINAARECAAEEGRLPTLGELIAYIAQPGEQVSAPNWSSDVADLGAGEAQVFTASESVREIKDGGLSLFKFRCLFYRTNNG
jgi:hypothetical protein